MNPAVPPPRTPPGQKGAKGAAKPTILTPILKKLEEWRGIYRSWPLDRRQSVALGVAFGFVAANLLAVFSPLCALTLKLYQKNAQIRLDYKSAVEDIQKRAEMETLLGDSAALLEKASHKTLGGAASEPLFLESLERAARARGLKLLQMDPFVKMDGAREESSAAALPAGYVEARTEVRLSGGFHAFGKFVADLENQDIFARILDLEAAQAPPETPKQHEFRILLGTVRRSDRTQK